MTLFKYLLAGALCAVSMAASAASYPTKTIRMIVPFGAGGITDIVARQLAKELGDQLGETIVVENRGGAGGAIGAQAASSSRADGYTVFMGTVGTQIVNELIMDSLNYDPAAFVPIGMISGSPYVLATRSTLDVDTLDDLVKYARDNPGALNFGSAGVGSSPQLGVELLKLSQGLDIVHVPFKSGGEAVNATAGGNVDLVMDAIPVVMPQAQGGKVKALALAANKRSPVAKDLMTSVEAGYEDLQISSWNALYVPEGTPDEVTDTLRDALQKALASEAFQKSLMEQGSEVYTGAMDEYETFIDAESSKWERIVKEANITLG